MAAGFQRKKMALIIVPEEKLRVLERRIVFDGSVRPSVPHPPRPRYTGDDKYHAQKPLPHGCAANIVKLRAHCAEVPQKRNDKEQVCSVDPAQSSPARLGNFCLNVMICMVLRGGNQVILKAGSMRGGEQRGVQING